MFNLTSRLVQAKEASNPASHHEDETVKAGRQAEESLIKDLVHKAGVPSSCIYQGLRVPDTFQTRRYEIDVVILTEYGIYCIEVKNWSGKISLSKNGKSWVRQKNIKDSNTQSSVTYDESHTNILQELKSKTQLIRNHLLRNEACLAEKFFFSRVVLMNPKSELDNSLWKENEIVTPDRYPLFLDSLKSSYSGKVAGSIVPSFITGQLSYSAMESARHALNQIGTWDIVHLHGGKQIIGDYKGNKDLILNRKTASRMEFKHQRSSVLGSLWAVMGFTPQVAVTIYKRGGEGWLWNATCAQVSVSYDAEISFRAAGAEVDAKIQANDIESITLST
ncbi:uncharacterized protein LOC121422813 [Lytechinus variegatus]|uniref:uncharacterized protein LOC121422813 n=1 Tax=Lytechinus variegatus TaxID=7654 RepID=UPI001BB2A58E|nr:uncharacterized protein LOC121422813 [Lytechinus variegatus]XP_041473953.1 uncharacterized protein LOC121422813 [Lytechinus variegatus]